MSSLKSFRKRKSSMELRRSILADWTIGKIGGYRFFSGNHLELDRVMLKDVKESKAFCGREVFEDTKLHEDWYLSIVIQAMFHRDGEDATHSLNTSAWVRDIFRVDYNQLLNPTADDLTTIEIWKLHNKDEFTYRMLTIYTGHIPTGSLWVSRKTGTNTEWRLISEDDDRVCELECYNNDKVNYTLTRSCKDLLKSFERIR